MGGCILGQGPLTDEDVQQLVDELLQVESEVNSLVYLGFH